MVKGSNGREASSTTWNREQDQPLRPVRRDLAVDSMTVEREGTCNTGDAGHGGQATTMSWKEPGWAEDSGSSDGRLHMMADEVADHVVWCSEMPEHWPQVNVTGHVFLGVVGVDRMGWKMSRKKGQRSGVTLPQSRTGSLGVDPIWKKEGQREMLDLWVSTECVSESGKSML